jgi:hypothetical protein
MKKQLFVVTFVLFVVTFWSCKEEAISESVNVPPVQSTENRSNVRENAGNPDVEMVLGKKLQNPYTVENMKLAYNNLKKTDKNISSLLIEANYVYVRFLPKSNEEYDLIDLDDKIDLYSYPLDYEITKNGNKYKDPSTTGNKFSWFYAAIPIGYPLPKKVKTEILSKLFLPHGNGNANSPEKVQKSTILQDNSLIEDLENEALRITGNLPNKTNGRVSAYIPTGRIMVRDTRIRYNNITRSYENIPGYVPVVGCQVRTRRWFSTETTLTLEDGTFNIGVSYNNPANYSIEWDREDFDIRSGQYGQAYFNGPKQEGRWDLNIENNGESYIYAHVHRAAYTYYYQSARWSIQAPPSRSYFSGLGIIGLIGHKMHLGVANGTGRSHYFDFNDNWFAAEIKLRFSLTNTTSSDSRNIFATTIHELAHSSHWKMGFNTALFSLHVNNRKLAESWAQAVGWQVTNSTYGALGFPPSDPEGLQFYTLDFIQNGPNFQRSYTPLFIDLIDNYNQFTADTRYPNEIVTGYNLGQLEGFLKQRPTNWYQLRDHIVSNNLATQNDTQTINLFNDYDN